MNDTGADQERKVWDWERCQFCHGSGVTVVNEDTCLEHYEACVFCKGMGGYRVEQ